VALHWPCLRLVQAGWCDLAGLKTMTMLDVDIANAALDAISDARLAAGKK
jgi:hypothetical protein